MSGQRSITYVRAFTPTRVERGWRGVVKGAPPQGFVRPEVSGFTPLWTRLRLMCGASWRPPTASMDLARYVVEAVVLQKRSYREVAEAHGVSKSWVGKVLSRYRQGGYAALQPHSKAAHRIPGRTPPEVEDRIVRLRKQLTDQGFDAGAHTIHYHLSVAGENPPSISTIWRVLRRRGFITAQPQNRRARAGSASKPACRTSAGSPTSPTGDSKTKPKLRSSTSSTTTRASSWLPRWCA